MILEKLSTFINNESRSDFRHYDLSQVRALLEHFGNPQNEIATIHIAGTNGKGSVAYMLYNMFMNAGYVAGLYTSPHLLKINERIGAHGNAISDESFNGYIDDIINYAKHNELVTPTFFDILTVCGFLYFRDHNVDIAIIETGLGGRLDSTNVIMPLCSIITDISMDHASILGNTIPAIAGEKAGIIKENIPVVTSNTASEAAKVIGEEASKKKAPLFSLNHDFSIDNISSFDDGFRFNYHCDRYSSLLTRVLLNSPLEFQIANSSLAITASLIVRERFKKLSDDVIRSVLKNFSVPGRFQVLSSKPLVIFDPAHNEAAIAAMMKHIQQKYADRKITCIITLMKDKDIRAILSVLNQSGITAIYFTLDDPRCFHPEESEYRSFFKDIIIHDETVLFSKLDDMASNDSLFFFIGSFRHYSTALNYAKHSVK